MAILDKQGLQHYANKMCNADNRKVGSKSLPTALNDIDTAIDGFKTLFETEYGTPVNMELENNENVFSIGTGTNIDKKNDVENSFTDVELSGNSLVNLVTTKGGNLFGISGNGVKFNRAYNTDLTRCIYTTQEETGSYITIRTGSKERIKSNTTYTLIFNIFKNNISELQKGISIRGSSDPYYTQTVSAPYFNIYTDSNFNITSGIKVISFTTGNNANEYTGFGFGFPSVKTNVPGQQFEIGDVILLEGDYTNKPIPQYFEGLKSIGEKEDGNHKISILSRGKNLCDINNFQSFVYEYIEGTLIDNKIIINNKDVASNERYSDGNLFKVKVKPNTTYTLSYKTDGVFGETNGTDTVETFVSTPNIAGGYLAFNIPPSGKSFNTGIHNVIGIRLDVNMGEKTHSFWDFQLEEGSTATEYEPYKEDKKEISLNEPLRGLPNGVKDTIEKVNGEWKIVRRCGETIFNGEENWILSDHNSETTSRYRLYLTTTDIAKKINSIGICDTIPVYSNSYWRQDFEMIENDTTYVSIRKKIYNNLNGFKQWLSQNPTKVIYELATPIIEDISPVTLQCWKNGTISLADEVLPVETTHTVALNKSAQIQKNIEELTTLRNRVKALEEQYDKTALNQAYEVELLRLDMQLDNII